MNSDARHLPHHRPCRRRRHAHALEPPEGAARDRRPPMLAHVLAAVREAGAGDVAVVVGPGRDDVAAEAMKAAPGASVFVQSERRGTAHAVLAARDAIARGYDDDSGHLRRHSAPSGSDARRHAGRPRRRRGAGRARLRPGRPDRLRPAHRARRAARSRSARTRTRPPRRKRPGCATRARSPSAAPRPCRCSRR